MANRNEKQFNVCSKLLLIDDLVFQFLIKHLHTC